MIVQRVIFLHHSVGRYLIRDGGLRARLADGSPPLELWDHDYNTLGLSDASGTSVGRAFPLPGDDTDPPALLGLFTANDAVTLAARRQVLEFDVVAMKSCYPNSAIGDDAQLASLRSTYQALISALATISGRQFVLLTSPPLIPLRTNSSQGRRARALADWLADTAASGPANVRVLDLFDRLAEPMDAAQANRLRRYYRRRLPVDSHPNRRAGREVAESIVAALQDAARSARE